MMQRLSERHLQPRDDRPTISGFDLDALPESFFQDPSPFYRELRQTDPIHKNRDGSVLLTRYEDVRAVWRDLSGTVEKRDYFRDRFGEGPLLEHFTTSMLFRDPPSHDRLRAILNPFFTRNSIERFRPHIELIVDQLIDEVAARGSIDFVEDFASKLPTSAICLALGLPLDDGNFVRELGHKMLVALNQSTRSDAIEAGHDATLTFKTYLLKRIALLREQPIVDPSANMLSALVAAQKDGGEISEDEIVHSAIVMFNGGHGTTTHLLAATLHYLLSAPAMIDDLREHPEIIESAIDEFIRFVTPVQLHWRRTTKELKIPSGTLAPGTEVVLCAGSANRDESAFADPDRVELRRQPNPHIAFGSGVHLCIGRPLSKLEVSIALPRFLARFKKFERLGPSKFLPLPKFRALDALPIKIS